MGDVTTLDKGTEPGTTETTAEGGGTSTGTLSAAVLQRKVQRRAAQRRAANEQAGGENVQEAADAGVRGAGHSLPHGDAIQKSFGRHDVSGVVAHTDAAAGQASRDMGASAFATGNHVAFAEGKADLHTAAHEAAHVVQQRAGVSLSGGVGQAGDAYEQHADAVADAVVRGGNAESLLDAMAGGGGGGGVQRQVQKDEDKADKAAGDAAKGPDPNTILDEGEKAVSAGSPATHIMPLDPQWTRSALEFKDPAAQRLLIHLITTWLGVADPTPLTEVLLDQEPPVPLIPKWVKRFRLQAMMGTKKDAADKQRLSTLATKLADAVLAKTDGEKFREDFLAGVQPGMPIMSQTAIDEENKNLKGKGKFTTCIAFAGSKVNAAIAKNNPNGKKFLGPNAYKEANAQATLTAAAELPPGSWKDAKTAEEPPKPGDMLIITYAEKTDIGEGDKKIQAQPGWFAHTNIIRAIGPVDPNDPELKAAEAKKKIDSPPDQTWYTIDGGGTTSKEGREFYNKSNQRLDSKYGKRFIKGWYDVAAMAGFKD